MGEYFNGVKLGTCSHLMYIRRDEVEKFSNKFPGENTSVGNLKHLKDYLGEFTYRFPIEKEDNREWDDINSTSNEPFKYISIDVDKDLVEMPHKDFMQTTIKGKTFNLPFCPYSKVAQEELKIRPLNDFGKFTINVVGQKYTKDNPDGYTIFECGMCGEWFAVDEKELEEIKRALKQAGYNAEADRVKAKK